MKESFVRYVRVIASGACEVAGGAVLGEDNVVEFPLVSATEAAGRWDLRFGGSVHFSAHHGALDVDLTGLRLDVGPDGGGVIVAGLAIASLPPATPTPRDGSLRWHALLPSLTEAGAPVFGNVYPPGTGLAPLDLDVPLDS